MAINEILFEMAMPGYNQRQQQMDLNNLLTMAKATAPGSMERDEVNKAIMQHPSFRALQQRLGGASVEFDWTGERITPLQQKQLDIREKEADWRKDYYSKRGQPIFDWNEEFQILQNLLTFRDTETLDPDTEQQVDEIIRQKKIQLFGGVGPTYAERHRSDILPDELDLEGIKFPAPKSRGQKLIGWGKEIGTKGVEQFKTRPYGGIGVPGIEDEEIPTITTDEEWDALKPGQRFMFEGQMRIKK